MARGTFRRNVKSYSADRPVVTVMTDLLQYMSDKENRRIVNKNRKRYLDKEKVKILDRYIFPSMANLTFFFKSISRYPQLKEIFDNDIKDLLGVNRVNPQQNNYGFIFSQLVRSILLIEEEAPSEEVADKEDFPLQYQLARTDINDFRLRLNHVLQDIIRIKAVDIDLAEVPKAEKHFIEDDFNRARLWTRIIARRTTQTTDENEETEDIENNNLPHRIIEFGRIPLREDEDPI
jgi:hypothetical protein